MTSQSMRSREKRQLRRNRLSLPSPLTAVTTALWKEEHGEKSTVAELIIDGNYIEFYNRDAQGINGCAFVGSDNDHRYKVFTNGLAEFGKYRTLNNVACYKTIYVLQQNCGFKKGFEIEGINSASFIIPELIDCGLLPCCTLRIARPGHKKKYAHFYYRGTKK